MLLHRMASQKQKNTERKESCSASMACMKGGLNWPSRFSCWIMMTFLILEGGKKAKRMWGKQQQYLQKRESRKKQQQKKRQYWKLNKKQPNSLSGKTKRSDVDNSQKEREKSVHINQRVLLLSLLSHRRLASSSQEEEVPYHVLPLWWEREASFHALNLLSVRVNCVSVSFSPSYLISDRNEWVNEEGQ